jgi:hypothetical protein
MIETGLHLVTGTGIGLHFAVDVQPDYAGIAVFTLCAPLEGARVSPDTIAFADLQQVLSTPFREGNAAGFLDLNGNGIFIPDLPGTAHGGIYKGRSYIFLDGMCGHDEIVDYSLIDIMTDMSGFPQPWRNRFALSAREKVDTSFRHRARSAGSNALVIFMPLKGDLSHARVEVLCNQDPILLNGTVVAGRIPDADIPKNGLWYRQFYFHGIATVPAITAPAGGQVDIPIALRWNADDSPLARSVTLKLEADAGYLPRRRLITTSEGTGIVTLEARGLSPGEHVHVKLNTEHYTAIGKIAVEVV